MSSSLARAGSRWSLAAALLGLAACSNTPAPSQDPNPSDGGYRVPQAGDQWQLVLTGDAPADPGAAVYDLDSTVTSGQLDELRSANPSVYLLCYLSVGTWEEWRSDAGAFPSRLIGEELPDWPGERYVDIRALDELAPLWSARLDACAAAGFDAVDPDNIDVYANDSGFAITASDVVAMMTWLATEAHARGLAIGQKNASELTPTLAPLLDFAVVEECLEQGVCDAYAPYAQAGKPIFDVEYPDTDGIPAGYCDAAAAAGMSLLVSPLELDAPGKRCA